MKKLLIATFCLFLSIPAMAASWTNWFTIDTLGYDLYQTNSTQAFFYIIPTGTVENPESCTSTSKYALGATSTSTTTPAALNNKEISKLPTLAYTAGWQIRLYLNGCEFNLPNGYMVEVKKP